MTRAAKPERTTRGAKRDRVIAEAALTLNQYGVSKTSLPLIAERLGVSRPTVRQALRHIADKGLVVRHRGIGTIVVDAPPLDA